MQWPPDRQGERPFVRVSERIESGGDCDRQWGELGSLQEISLEYSDMWSLTSLFFRLADGQWNDGCFYCVPAGPRWQSKG